MQISFLRVNSLRLGLVLLALICATVAARAQSGGTIPPASVVTAARYATLTRGVNVPRWFHIYSSLDQVDPNSISDAELKTFRVLGIKHVRMPVSMKLLTPVIDPGPPNPVALQKLDAIIERMLAHKLGVIVTLFDVNSLSATGATRQIRNEHAQKLAAFWRVLARSLSKHDPERVFLETLNEPLASFATDWYEQQPKVLAAMREGAPRHTLIADANLNLSPSYFDTVASIEAIRPVADPNVIYNFHIYKPHAFSHQATNFPGSLPQTPYLDKMPYPATPAQLEEAIATYTPSIQNYVRGSYLYPDNPQKIMPTWNAAHFASLFDRIVAWADTYSTSERKVFITANEFGVYRGRTENGARIGVEPDARHRWLRDVRMELERHGLSWATWGHEDSFGIGQRGGDGIWRPDAGDMEALGLAMDTTPPVVSFVLPTANSSLQSLRVLKGFAVDAGQAYDENGRLSNAGSGVTRVEAELFRETSNGREYWDATARRWSAATPPRLPVSFEAIDNSWSLSFAPNDTHQFPQGADLPDGTYFVRVTAFDLLNNSGSSTNAFQVGAGLPRVAITSPADGTVQLTLNDIRGTAGAGQSTLSRVHLFIQRSLDRKYWVYFPATQTFGWSAQQSGNLTTNLTSTGTWSRFNDASGRMPTGANLVDSNYIITATAFDSAGRNSQTVSTVLIDRAAPTIAFSTPQNGERVRSLSTLSGTVSDSNQAPGSGAARVVVQIQRADNFYWNGSAWNETAASLPTVLNTPRNAWSCATGLQPPALTSGAYRLSATAFDRLDNTRTVSINVVADVQSPQVSISNPSDGAILRVLSAARGLATDEAGLSRVDLTLRRNSDGLFWSGLSWGAGANALTTTLSSSDNSWSLREAMPSGNLLPSGTYTLSATAVDAAGNVATSSSQVLIDKIAPIVSITTPAANATLSSLNSVSGQASDEAGGSALNRVNLVIQRNSDGRFWNGGAWVVTQAGLPTILNGTSWTRSIGMPTSSSLSNGTYSLKAVAHDRAGNSAVARITITIATGAGA